MNEGCSLMTDVLRLLPLGRATLGAPELLCGLAITVTCTSETAVMAVAQQGLQPAA